MLKRFTATTAALLLIVACGDQTTEPNLDLLPQFAKTANLGHCATDPDWVVSTELELQAAVNGADQGDVIAVDGMITLEVGMGDAPWGFPAGILVEDKTLTFTCATPGAGLQLGAGPPQWESLVFVTGGSAVTIENLKLRGDQIPPSGYTVGVFSWYGGSLEISNSDLDFSGHYAAVYSTFTEALRLVANEFEGTPRYTVLPTRTGAVEVSNNNFSECDNICLFVAGVLGSPYQTNLVTVKDNEFAVTGGGMAVPTWIQNIAGPLRLTGNTMTTEFATTSFAFALYSVSNSVIEDNIISGPFLNGPRLRRMETSVFRDNEIEGTLGAGLILRESNGNLVKNNLFTNVGLGGVLVDGGSFENVLLGNQFKNTSEFAAYFDESTGWNTFVGKGDAVVDLGTSNKITGHGSLKGGLHIGQLLEDLRAMDVLDPLPMERRGGN
jgi:nitrous oxidase accessory protein NosD